MASALDSFKPLVEAKDGGVAAIDLILEWIHEKSSKFAREALDKFNNEDSSNPYMLRDAYSTWGSAKTPMTVELALSIPFFSFVEDVSVEDAAASAKRKHSSMSGNVAKSGRQVLKDAYGYDVRFRQWQRQSLREDILVANIQKADTKCLPRIVMKLIESSYDNGVCSTGEIQELTTYANIIKDLLKTFGFKLQVKSPPAVDFIVSYDASNEGKKEFLFGEAKQISSLPNKALPSGTSHELCLFGFATYVAKYNPDVSQTLTSLLGLQETSKKKDETNKKDEKKDCLASKMAKSLLAEREGILEVAASIKSKLAMKEVRPGDALNLWAAVMQACHCSVSKKKQVSIVMSVRMMWFIRLFFADQDDGGCCIAVSDGTLVGSKGCNEELIYFLAYAQSLEDMSKESQRLWQNALKPPSKSDQEKDTKGNSNTNTSLSHGDGEESGHETEDGKVSTNTHSTQASSSLQVSPSTMKPTEDFEDLDVKQGSIARAISTDEADLAVSFQGKDKYGVIPYFDQIGEPLEVLGYGRCGTVSKIKWGKEYAALKEFVIQPESEDDRYFYDVYEYELEVLHNLRPLWGKYVPALLFHKPWATSPVIGLQLGEPIEEDYIGNWPKEDQVKVEETIAEVKALGWEQADYRGTNFVRLVGQDGTKRIAMIDFESLVRC
jgi:hypothetical protein